ncbi:glycoside hydrolase family 43 protein [Amycolatopsis sp. NPDC051045]|uniref:glycoside hydrolase family 43 protein n=1 Tax=Amycolatopsis sp. NPDC051045 TaxID=3156922 RepID=UPI00342E91C5
MRRFRGLIAVLLIVCGLTAPAGPAGAGSSRYAGYLFVYFAGEGTPDGEQVHFALSQGNDPLRWREPAGRPALRSTLGTGGIRDPYVIRSPRGDGFYLIATDLRMYGRDDWDQAQRHGSRSIVVWESTDLVRWGEPRLVAVAPDTAGHAWAPEAFYDPVRGAYVVFWASTLYPPGDPGHTTESHNRIMYATTEDFRTFGEPRVWFDPGHSVIDSTVIEHNGTYHRFSQDDRGPGGGGATPCGRYITQEKAAVLTSRTYALVKECIGEGAIVGGEGPLVFRSNTEKRWYLFIDEYGGRGYQPFETTDLESGDWRPAANAQLPAGLRHGTVLPVTRAEYHRLAAKYGAAAGTP